MRTTETLILKIYEEAFAKFNLGLAYALSGSGGTYFVVFTLIYYKLDVEES